MFRSIPMLLVLAVAAVPLAAMAQNPQPAPPGVQAPVAPPNAASPPPEKVAPGALDKQADNQNLSDRSSRQRGTLHPGNVDPGISIAPPARGQGTMPVIPPPGTPGGNQNVVPK
jgi:hypothetical protein